MRQWLYLALAVIASGCTCGSPLVQFDGGLHCPDGQTLCGTTCAATVTDTANCGACGHACATGEACAASQCFPKNCPTGNCSSTQVCRMSACVDTTCLNVTCTGQTVCNKGTCVTRLCAGVDCGDGLACLNGVCVDVACQGVTCAVGQCSKGSCGGTLCPGVGQAVDLNTDPQHCGACDRVCVPPAHAGSACVAASCVRGPCVSPYYDLDGDPTNGCEGRCVDTTCTLGNGTQVTVTVPPLPYQGQVGAELATGSSFGPAQLTSPTNTNIGILGEPTPTVESGANIMSNSANKNIGGFSANLQR